MKTIDDEPRNFEPRSGGEDGTGEGCVHSELLYTNERTLSPEKFSAHQSLCTTCLQRNGVASPLGIYCAPKIQPIRL
ncbi:hypothetical protein TNCV_1585551 [Trichonephila clavipes]|nr:hypothetical protein TNCV_1585551 [Trichonephila clavipes]